MRVPVNKGTLSSGATVLIAILLLIATLVVFILFYGTLGEGSTSLNSGITSNLTDIITR